MKIVKINTDHYVIVDDSEIKDGDWVLDVYDNSIKLISNTVILPLDKDYWKKITHSTQPIEPGLSSSDRTQKDYVFIKPLSLSEVKELLGEVDVEKKVYSIVEKVMGSHNMKSSTAKDMISIGMSSYNQALEDNKDKKYTRNEVHALMCRAFEQGLKKADILEAGLEGKETDVECAWILTRHDSTPKTEWEVEFDENGKLKLV